MTIKEQAEKIVKILEDKKAEDIELIYVADKTIISDWFIICSGRSVPHVKALCDEVDEKTKEFGLAKKRIEGYNDARWVVMDYGTILVHIFHPEEREYYKLGRLWQ